MVFAVNKMLISFVLLLSFCQSQPKRLSDADLVLLVLNNNNTRAVYKDSTLFVYVSKGSIHIKSLKECAEISSAKKLVLITAKGSETINIGKN